MVKLQLTVEKRKIFGRQVKKLRQAGILPANIYGKKTKSLAVAVKLADFSKVYKQTGETGIVELKVEKEEKTRPVLIHNVQTHPVTDYFLHVDFHQVVLTEKTRAVVPVAIVGQSRAVTDKKGVLLTILSELEAEALPKDLPEKLEIDVRNLLEVDDQILVKDIKVAKGVVILNQPEEVVVKIGALTKEEVAPPKEAAPLGAEKPAAEKAEAAAAAAEQAKEGERAGAATRQPEKAATPKKEKKEE